MDINRTEALTQLLRGRGWDISPNAYRHEYAGIFVSSDGRTGEVYINRSGFGLNLSQAQKVAADLEAVDGIDHVVVHEPDRGYAVTVTFDCTGFTKSAAQSAATWGAATQWR